MKISWLASALLSCGLLFCSGERSDPDLDFQRGLNAVSEGRPDWGRVYFARDYAQHPQRGESLKRAGLCWISGYQRGVYKAIELFEAYLVAAGRDDEVEAHLIRSLMLIGEHERARNRFERLGGHPDYDLLAAEVWVASQPALALEHARRVPANSTGHALALALACEAAQNLGRLESAVTLGERSVAGDPFSFQVFYRLARMYRQLGRMDDSQRALEIHGILLQLQAGRGEAALPASEELDLVRRLRCRIGRQHVAIQKRECRLFFLSGELEQAIGSYESLTASGAFDFNERSDIARLAHERGLRSLAEKIFRSIHARDPHHRGAVASLALLAHQAGKRQEALELLAQGLETHPHFARYHYLTGLVHAAEGRELEAETAFRHAVDLAPWQIEWRNRLADHLAALGRQREALRVRDEAPMAEQEI